MSRPETEEIILELCRRLLDQDTWRIRIDVFKQQVLGAQSIKKQAQFTVQINEEPPQKYFWEKMGKEEWHAQEIS